LGINVPVVSLGVFAIGGALAGLAGVIGGSVLSISPGEDGRYLLSSLIVVILGGMGSIPGAAIGAVLVAMAETYGLAYTPTYGAAYMFLIMVAVLAVRPRGLLGRSA
jgi:branched-chain amino acid transport system permease protein